MELNSELMQCDCITNLDIDLVEFEESIYWIRRKNTKDENMRKTLEDDFEKLREARETYLGMLKAFYKEGL